MKNQTIIITGGTGDIGKEIVKLLLPENFEIVVMSRKGKEDKDILNKKISYLPCDVTDYDDVAKNILVVNKKKPPLYGLINCVGVNILKKFDEYSMEEIEKLVNVNLMGTINVIQNILPTLKKQKFGKIVNIASQAGIAPQKYNIVYSITKAGIVALTKGLAKECAEFSIAINSICPGDIESEMMENAINDLSEINSKSIQENKNEIINSIPSRRLGLPKEVAELVVEVFMVKTQFLTGANIVIAGGRTCY